MSSGGGRLREVVAYESLDHNGQNYSSLEYDNCGDLTHAPILRQFFIHVKVNFEKKIRFFPLRNFRLLY